MTDSLQGYCIHGDNRERKNARFFRIMLNLNFGTQVEI